MSLSRRPSSSRSTSSGRRPLLSVSKASAAPSLSLVFAEPVQEPRKRKQSASLSLKGMWAKEKEPKVEAVAAREPPEQSAVEAPEPTSESITEPVRQPTPPPPPVDSIPPPPPPPVSDSEPTPTPVDAAEPSPDVASEPQPIAQSSDTPEPAPTTEASSVAFPSTSPPSRSWFGSLGRARGRDKARVYVESTLKESTTITTDTTQSESNTQPVTTDVLSESPTSTSSTPIAIPPSSQPPQPTATPSPSRSPSQTGQSYPSSIDEHVPALPTTPPASELHVPERRRVTSSPSSNLNHLNPSTSRFTLSIPLLGRAKVPLDEAMAKSAPASVAETVKETPETHVEVKEEITVQEQTPPGDAHSVSPSTTTSTSSWWNYVGWSDSQPSAEHSQESSEEQTVDATPPLPTPTQAEPEPESSGIVDPAPKRDRAMSVSSSDTSSRASWYAPWAWYGSMPAVGETSETESDTAPPVGAATHEGLTPSERVREEALARPETTVETVASNAILETASNRSSWASFFTSVNRKTIEPGPEVKRDEHGNEIMDIEEEEEVASLPSPARNPPLALEEAKKSAEFKRTTAPQLTISDDVKKEASSSKRKVSTAAPPKPPPSPTPKEKKKPPVPPSPPVIPNLLLPTWNDIFKTPPRAHTPEPPAASSRLLRFITGKGKSREDDLPFLLEGGETSGWGRSCKRVVVIGIHGWFPGAIMRTMLGEPTGTSPKFVAMMEQALDEFQKRHNVKFDKVTGMPLEGEGTIGGRVEKLYNALMENESWVSDLHEADAILVATHSQGSVVSTHLLNRLIEEGHIVTALAARAIPDELIGMRKVQRICCLALCGIHLGPLRYLSTSSLLQPYFQYLETQAARELFEFQNTDSDVSKAYVGALRNVVHHGTKMVYIASLNDQVVPLYSGLFTSASHPLILRALYIDGDAYHSSDFLSNLLVLLIRILNSGLSDSGLISLLSEATAGSLNGVGHSTAYEDIATYSLAVDYLFRTTPGPLGAPLTVESFDAAQEQNDYEIPWALRDLIAEERVRQLVGGEFGVLKAMFGGWKPRTAILRDVKRKLGPIQRLGSLGGGQAQPQQGQAGGKAGGSGPSKL